MEEEPSKLEPIPKKSQTEDGEQLSDDADVDQANAAEPQKILTKNQRLKIKKKRRAKELKREKEMRATSAPPADMDLKRRKFGPELPNNSEAAAPSSSATSCSPATMDSSPQDYESLLRKFQETKEGPAEDELKEFVLALLTIMKKEGPIMLHFLVATTS